MSFVEVRTINNAVTPIERRTWLRLAVYRISHILGHNLRTACMKPECDMPEDGITDYIG